MLRSRGTSPGAPVACRGRWERKQGGVELNGKVGIIGLARGPGRCPARSRVRHAGASLPAERTQLCDGVQEVETLDDLFREAGFISLHPSLTDQTRSVMARDPC